MESSVGARQIPDGHHQMAAVVCSFRIGFLAQGMKSVWRRSQLITHSDLALRSCAHCSAIDWFPQWRTTPTLRDSIVPSAVIMKCLANVDYLPAALVSISIALSSPCRNHTGVLFLNREMSVNQCAICDAVIHSFIPIATVWSLYKCTHLNLM